VMKCEILIITPTYRRPKILAKMVKQIIQETKRTGMTVLHIVRDDKSEKKFLDQYRQIEKSVAVQENYTFQLLVSDEHCGRPLFWKHITALFEETKKHEYDYVVFLGDDLILCKDFLTIVPSVFTMVRALDSGAQAMNLLNIHPTNWGFTRWLDGQFIATYKFFKAIDWRCPANPARFAKDPSARTGMWKDLSKYLQPSGIIAEGPPVSFVWVQDNPSVMYPESEFGYDAGGVIPYVNNFIGGMNECDCASRGSVNLGDKCVCPSAEAAPQS
jgi:hypothetical protein